MPEGLSPAIFSFIGQPADCARTRDDASTSSTCSMPTRDNQEEQ